MEARGLEGQRPLGAGVFRRSDFRHWGFWYDQRWVLSSGGRDPPFGHCTLTSYTGPFVGLRLAVRGYQLWFSVQIHWAPKSVRPPCKIKLLHSFSSLLSKELQASTSRSSSTSFSSAHPPHPCLSARLKGSSRCMWLRARVIYFWRNKAGGIAGRLRQRPGEGWKGRFRGSGQRD